MSLLLHGNALNITCVSYAGTLNFGLTGARDTLPHLQRLAIYMGEALTQIERLLLGKSTSTAASKAAARSNGKAPAKRAPARAKRSRARTTS